MDNRISESTDDPPKFAILTGMAVAERSQASWRYNLRIMSLSSGMKLGPYEIEAPLGAGGMGEVYKARDTRLDLTTGAGGGASRAANSVGVW